jgi:cytoplasmic iron level regulating protein YaaA (DUF328/UPF0246 family)
MDKAVSTDLYTKPIFIREAHILMEKLIKYSPDEMESLMKVNSKLAEYNFLKHLQWKPEHDLSNGKQAILTFDGAVYRGINPEHFNEHQLSFANEHIRILSGLYGALRPLDIIQPYRLEMAAKLKNISGNDLYSFWRDKLTDYFKKELYMQNNNVLINLASKEYSSAINLDRINAEIITPAFMDYRRGSYKVITIYAKRARGLMSRFIIENSIVSPGDLKEFYEEGYSYSEYMSTNAEWVFLRQSE